MARLVMQLLGSPRIEVGGKPVSVDTRKATALLVYLAVTGGSHSRDFLAALLWPEYDQSSARGALRRTLSTLRKGAGEEFLEASWEAVGLAKGADLWLDVARFKSLLEECKRQCPAPDAGCGACLARLNEAVALYRGDFLAGFSLRDSPNFDEWQFYQGDELRRLLAEGLERLVYAHFARGDFEAAISSARRWLSLDPLREEAHRLLMQCYAWSGERGAALRQYRECVRILQEELGVPPLEETTGLYEAIKENRDAGQIPARPPRISPTAAQGPAPETVVEAPLARGLSPGEALPLVGRSRQSAELLRLYERRGAQGCFVALTGEPGVGKTRLAAEFLAYVRTQGATVIPARCYEGETGLAYGPFIEGLRAALASPESAEKLRGLQPHWLAEAARLLPELAGLASTPVEALQTLLEGPGAQSRFYEGLRRMIEKLCEGPVPGVLFLDDINWADAASLDLLTYLARRLNGSPLFILAAWRGDLVQPGHRLHLLFTDLQRQGKGHLLELERLSPAHVAELARAVPQAPPGFGEQLYRETEGLPYFVTEYLSSLAQGFPPEEAETGALAAGSEAWSMPLGVRSLLQSRLAAVGDAGWQLLTAAAVIGRSFDFDTLREASGRSEMETIAGLESLIAHGLVEERVTGELRYDFTHEKLRALVYEETSPPRRRLLHRRVAEALSAPGAPGGRRSLRDRGTLAGQIAQHYLLGGQDAAAAEHFRLAGDQARAVYANLEALQHYQAALAAGYPQPAELHELIGDLQTLRGEYGAALASYETAAALGEAGSLARLEHKLGNVHQRRGSGERAVAHFQAALDAAGSSGEAGEERRLLADWSLSAFQQGRATEARELAQRAASLAEAASDGPALAQAHNILGILSRGQGDLEAARRHLERSLEISRSAGDPQAQAAALNNLALVFARGGDYERAIANARTALEICRQQGDRHREAALLNNLADLHHASGHPEEAMDYLKKAVVIFAEIGVEAGSPQPEIWKLAEW